jgi:hypothetical protein
MMFGQPGSVFRAFISDLRKAIHRSLQLRGEQYSKFLAVNLKDFKRGIDTLHSGRHTALLASLMRPLATAATAGRSAQVGTQVLYDYTNRHSYSCTLNSL